MAPYEPTPMPTGIAVIWQADRITDQMIREEELESLLALLRRKRPTRDRSRVVAVIWRGDVWRPPRVVRQLIFARLSAGVRGGWSASGRGFFEAAKGQLK